MADRQIDPLRLEELPSLSPQSERTPGRAHPSGRDDLPPVGGGSGGSGPRTSGRTASNKQKGSTFDGPGFSLGGGGAEPSVFDIDEDTRIISGLPLEFQPLRMALINLFLGTILDQFQQDPGLAQLPLFGDFAQGLLPNTPPSTDPREPRRRTSGPDTGQTPPDIPDRSGPPRQGSPLAAGIASALPYLGAATGITGLLQNLFGLFSGDDEPKQVLPHSGGPTGSGPGPLDFNAPEEGLFNNIGTDQLQQFLQLLDLFSGQARQGSPVLPGGGHIPYPRQGSPTSAGTTPEVSTSVDPLQAIYDQINSTGVLGPEAVAAGFNPQDLALDPNSVFYNPLATNTATAPDGSTFDIQREGILNAPIAGHGNPSILSGDVAGFTSLGQGQGGEAVLPGDLLGGQPIDTSGTTPITGATQAPGDLTDSGFAGRTPQLGETPIDTGFERDLNEDLPTSGTLADGTPFSGGQTTVDPGARTDEGSATGTDFSTMLSNLFGGDSFTDLVSRFSLPSFGGPLSPPESPLQRQSLDFASELLGSDPFGQTSNIQNTLTELINTGGRFDLSPEFAAIETRNNQQLEDQINQMNEIFGTKGLRFGSDVARGQADLRSQTLAQTQLQKLQAAREAFEGAQGRRLESLTLPEQLRQAQLQGTNVPFSQATQLFGQDTEALNRAMAEFARTQGSLFPLLLQFALSGFEGDFLDVAPVVV